VHFRRGEDEALVGVVAMEVNGEMILPLSADKEKKETNDLWKRISREEEGGGEAIHFFPTCDVTLALIGRMRMSLRKTGRREAENGMLPQKEAILYLGTKS